MNSYRIGIIDDNRKIGEQLKQRLSLAGHNQILFYADRGEKGIAWLQQHEVHPELLLMDIEMPGMDGIETTFRIKQTYPEIKIIMLSVFDSEDNIFNAIKAGASGYLLKDESIDKIMHAFDDAMAGGAPMSSLIASKTLAMLTSGYKPDSKVILEHDPEKQLSKRETEILTLLASGMKNSQVAEKLYLSDFTVKKHIENIYNKLCIHSRVELINWYNKK